MVITMKTALITGASGGIGLKFAHILASQGFDLILVARSTERLIALKDAIQEKYHIAVYPFSVDLSLPDGVNRVYQFVHMEGLQVDILINNAGFGHYGNFIHSSWEKESSMISLNIHALTQMVKLFYPEMVKRRYGRILNVASVAAFEPGPLMAVYYASKSYVLSFTEALANEAKGTGVTFTALCPGPTISGFADAADLETSKLFKILPLDTTDHVAKVGYKAMMKGKTVIIPGLLNQIMIFSVRFTPRKMVTWLVRKIQDPKKHKS